MTSKPELLILIVPFVSVAVIIVVGIIFFNVRAAEEVQPTLGMTAAATLETPEGETIGNVEFRQVAAGVLVMAEVNGLSPGGHAFIIHEIGACTPDFNAAGDHFNPEDVEHGFVHQSWKRSGASGGHSGDLPNIYAASDGSARADFFTDGITLDTGPDHSIFDADGAAIIVHEKPDDYGERESDTGNRLACGVIKRS